MATVIKHRRGTAATWSSVNPVLSSGEIGVESDTGTFKVGDGSTPWLDLGYFVDETGVADLIESAVSALPEPLTLQQVAAASEVRAAALEAVEDAEGVAPVGTWNFTEAPQVNGNPVAVGDTSVADATTAQKGVVLLASLAQMATGTDPTRVATVAGVRQERLALRDEILGGVGAMADTLQELYALAQSAEETQAINDLITVVNGKASQADLTALTTTVNAKPSQTAVDAKADKPITGVTMVQQFVYTDPAVARPAVPTYVSLNWVGPAGTAGAAPTNMATNDTWDMKP